ncbi:hypothetical protein MWU57_09490 [Isoptericola sp. S6320L]|uniref:hypothetical protein n=1 Tax=Isoptericola sp. S6320L TaxID=2926411 RepID=UPI001FF65C82|nr:hypothetical protein [Isoptericola sp. S6320L]MCK0117266.1 hypothetical protein [Isoptericola sp. S6320L]
MKNRILGTFAALCLALASVGMGAGAAHADDDDRVSCTGYASKNAQYRVTLAERDDDRMRAAMRVDAAKPGQRWTVTVYRNGSKAYRITERANRHGNISVARTVRGDDDDRFRFVAVSSSGQRAARTVELDDDLECRSGKGSKGSRYGYSVQESGDDRVTAQVRVNGPTKGARWTATFYRDGSRVASTTSRANSFGNVTLGRTFGADDDRVKVVVRSSTGERISRTVDLDD